MIAARPSLQNFRDGPQPRNLRALLQDLGPRRVPVSAVWCVPQATARIRLQQPHVPPHLHPSWLRGNVPCLGGNRDPLTSCGFVSEETQQRFQWLQWVVERNMHLSEVDDMSCWKPVSSKTVKRDMQRCSTKVGVVKRQLAFVNKKTD
ncbi:hypothetical protein L914_06901 [Phytophthora nicotianae]|uniref:Uncharacterized protein n=2 Tax=Phytophthora nicotianae TaxID=4792 RepID=V9ELW7_PHYNI|nr:hypothetical protein F443_15307 [Phytophthora nicotianae P1569]ETM48570.1 hypothetical protein L914_06901 [Phytophthora nicotianae]